jgi:hypothetical protein
MPLKKGACAVLHNLAIDLREPVIEEDIDQHDICCG